MRQLDGREVAVLLMDTQAQSVTRCSHGDGAVGMGITALKMVQVFLIT